MRRTIVMTILIGLFLLTGIWVCIPQSVSEKISQEIQPTAQSEEEPKFVYNEAPQLTTLVEAG